MKVSLRQRKRSGKTILYLDYYHKGKRKLEYLSLYLKPDSRKPEDREKTSFCSFQFRSSF